MQISLPSEIKRLSKLSESIHGAAAGGGICLALDCDFIIASEKASFGEVFINIG